ncbi:Fur family transcriptional regulator [Miniphocaeibacter massiliensis]|uniref:Fur family transcriptional regulator n=1 Tax=Miniphocaeibacter massiliensis TaxID=2041841 RepID=UPI000C083C84|nr:Fur family transcriptional regulator [Miniphocaeibacter massiliensis]
MENIKNIDTLKDILIDASIRPTYQRIKILDYLNQNHTHPTVDEIYISLCPYLPTLSKTTVYNTLNSFVKANIVSEIQIENTEIRYDLKSEPHGHFKCKECGKIFDFALGTKPLKSDDLTGFVIDTKNVYFSGTCPECQDK